ncbi:hypothetical protein SDC9_142538 [bioreactor metagenome]|uniref:Uncharacterized protein n=1 Tax=bioreactor metagenome TaxID=1076179 RepID=A0A645E0R7_9ZZZZ
MRGELDPVLPQRSGNQVPVRAEYHRGNNDARVLLEPFPESCAGQIRCGRIALPGPGARALDIGTVADGTSLGEEIFPLLFCAEAGAAWVSSRAPSKAMKHSLACKGACRRS